jgi:5-methylcytosine-specific restriction endonuclease McrA
MLFCLGTGRRRGLEDKPSNMGEANITPARMKELLKPLNSHNRVFVLDTDKRPLTPCRPARARQLLSGGLAAAYRRYPFTIILKKAMPNAVVEPVRLKIDPGSKTTGFALVEDRTNRAVFAAELEHRGQQIKSALDSRRAVRRSRRNRKTRYRQARWRYRTRLAGWLPPSLMHRVHTVMTWVARFRRYTRITAISLELIRFDTQALQNPEISGVEYQQGTLAGYEVREYLLEKWERKCAYCDAESVPLQVEHLHPRSRGGSDRISNLVIACEACNEAKGAKNVREFVTDESRLQNILKQAKTPLKECRRCQRHPLETVRSTQERRTTTRNRNRRTHQVQPLITRASESALARCGLRG